MLSRYYLSLSYRLIVYYNHFFTLSVFPIYTSRCLTLFLSHSRYPSLYFTFRIFISSSPSICLSLSISLQIHSLVSCSLRHLLPQTALSHSLLPLTHSLTFSHQIFTKSHFFYNHLPCRVSPSTKRSIFSPKNMKTSAEE